MRPTALLNQVRTNPHSPAKWRTIGVAQNTPDFAKVFKFKAGAPMNPARSARSGGCGLVGKEEKEVGEGDHLKQP